MTQDTTNPAQSIDEPRLDERFQFGENWARFLTVLNDERIEEATKSLSRMLNVKDLRGLRFVDVGCGSGMFSLAARKLGATVHSFDFDPNSVACTQEIKRRCFPDDSQWTIEQGSVLDDELLARLGQFDIVYSWGVLHHTGHMWKAIEKAETLVRDGGLLFIAIYNDQGGDSRRWRKVKKLYNQSPAPIRWLILIITLIKIWTFTVLVEFLRGKPFYTWRNYKASARGMSPWHDHVDWIGGYPFEVAKPEDIFNYFRDKGYRLLVLKTCGGGKGCNEFVFKKETAK